MLRRALLVLCLGLALAACESTEERAEKHFQTGMQLLADGDVARAMVEFRNVFQLNGRHLQARLIYAKLERDRGNASAAYSQYLRVVEQYPDNVEALTALADLALQAGNWDDLRRYGAMAAALAPDEPLIRAVNAAGAYQATLQTGDTAARQAAVAEARELVPLLPDSLAARRVVIDSLLRDENWPAALTEIDAGLGVQPDLRDLYTLRLGVLERLGDKAALEAQLKDMTVRFAADPSVHATLIRWYLSQRNLDAAEAYLRQRVTDQAADPAAAKAARMELVRFLAELRGPDVARTELDGIIAANPADAAMFRALRAGLDFEGAGREAAITEMEAILNGAPPNDETHTIRISLARMLFTTGNQVGARAQVEQVLTEDPTQVEALKLKARWLIDDDRTGDAMLELRAALNQSPRDAEVMTLMALAHERDGNRDLMGEMLSLAVEASGRAPDETLRYAAFLIQDRQYPTAEEALNNALRLAPGNLQLMALLGDLYLRTQDWARVEQVVAQLRRMPAPDAGALANDMTARLFVAQNRTDELAEFLGSLSTSGEGGIGVEAALIRTMVAEGNVTGALEHAKTLLDAQPSDPSRRFIYASVLALSGDDAQAETLLRGIVAENPGAERAWQTLYALLAARGDMAGAMAALDAALVALPDSVQLHWAKASALQMAGDIDGAIAIYENLYDRDSSSMVFANNLASLLSTARDDAESLERAYLVSRRLRGSELAPYQDTYGWIAYRRGNYDEALTHLEPAAQGIPQDPSVQYHLAMTYAALDRREDALAQFAKVDALKDESFPPAFEAAMQQQKARLAALPDAPDGN